MLLVIFATSFPEAAKNFAGASGLWYHNKHVHGAETQLRPRKPKNNAFAVPSN